MDFAKSNLDQAKKFGSGPSFKPYKDSKKIRLDDSHPERYVTIGAGLDPK